MPVFSAVRPFYRPLPGFRAVLYFVSFHVGYVLKGNSITTHEYNRSKTQLTSSRERRNELEDMLSVAILAIHATWTSHRKQHEAADVQYKHMIEKLVGKGAAAKVSGGEPGLELLARCMCD